MGRLPLKPRTRWYSLAEVMHDSSSDSLRPVVMYIRLIISIKVICSRVCRYLKTQVRVPSALSVPSCARPVMGDVVICTRHLTAITDASAGLVDVVRAFECLRTLLGGSLVLSRIVWRMTGLSRRSRSRLQAILNRLSIVLVWMATKRVRDLSVLGDGRRALSQERYSRLRRRVELRISLGRTSGELDGARVDAHD